MKKLILLFVILLIIPLVFADYPTMNPPHIFEGSVTVNGAPAPDDILITARMEDDLEKDVASTTTINGKYRLKIGDPYGDRAGEIVHFFINGHDTGQTITWNTSSSITIIDLSIDGINLGESDNSDNSGDGGSTDGGSSSSGGNSKTTNEENKEECIPDWICSSWSDCISGVQNRVCVDQNRCNTEEGKPEEHRTCEMPEKTKENNETAGTTPVTGLPVTAFIVNKTSFVYGATIIIVIIILYIIYRFWISPEKKKTKKKKK